VDASKRNLIAGLVGIVVLLIGVLLYAQVTASHNFDLSEYGQHAE
jgi:formate hydrogenlyase subunit 3/multisubunit Na+/H+ antiporter MnhD subunit